jgi:hypothetical protein
MDLATQIDEHGLATPLAKLDADRESTFWAQGKLGSGGPSAKAIAAVGGDKLFLGQSAENIGNAGAGQAAMPAKLHPRQRAMSADRFQDDANISIGDFTGPQTDCFGAWGAHLLSVKPTRP